MCSNPLSDVAYYALPDAEKRALVNGCGAKGSWLRPPHWFNITWCCNLHDWLYSLGGPPEQRLAADRRLRTCILARRASFSRWNPKRLYYVVWAWAFYYGVRLGGGKSWGTK